MKKKSLILLISGIFTVSPAFAKDAYNLTHDVYAGGVHTLQTRMRIEETGQNYAFDFDGQAYGLLAKFVPWIGSFDTKGWIVKGNFHPEKHVSDTVTKDKREVNTFVYSKDRGFKAYSHVIDGKDETDEKLDRSLATNSVDVLTAALQMMKSTSKSGNCQGEARIFDGERNYDLVFKETGTEKLIANKYNFYSGETIKCTAEVKPLGGRWHKKPRGWLRVQEQSRAKGMLPTIWLARLSKNPYAPYFPVKAFVKSDYGAFVINLTSFRDSDGQLKVVSKKP